MDRNPVFWEFAGFGYVSFYISSACTWPPEYLSDGLHKTLWIILAMQVCWPILLDLVQKFGKKKTPRTLHSRHKEVKVAASFVSGDETNERDQESGHIVSLFKFLARGLMQSWPWNCRNLSSNNLEGEIPTFLRDSASLRNLWVNIEPFSLIILFVSSNLRTRQVSLQLLTNGSFIETKRKPILITWS